MPIQRKYGYRCASPQEICTGSFDDSWRSRPGLGNPRRDWPEESLSTYHKVLSYNFFLLISFFHEFSFLIVFLEFSYMSFYWTFFVIFFCSQNVVITVSFLFAKILNFRCRFLCRALGVYALAQLPESKSEQQLIRFTPHSPGVTPARTNDADVMEIRPSLEAIKGMQALESLVTNKQYAELKTDVEQAIRMIKDSGNSLHNAVAITGLIATELYTRRYLHLLVDHWKFSADAHINIDKKRTIEFSVQYAWQEFKASRISRCFVHFDYANVMFTRKLLTRHENPPIETFFIEMQRKIIDHTLNNFFHRNQKIPAHFWSSKKTFSWTPTTRSQITIGISNSRYVPEFLSSLKTLWWLKKTTDIQKLFFIIVHSELATGNRIFPLLCWTNWRINGFRSYEYIQKLRFYSLGTLDWTPWSKTRTCF